VHVLVPRSLRRLARVMHAFGPLSAAGFQVLGGGAKDACFEDDLGLATSPAVEADAFLAELEQALDRAHVPYTFSSSDVARYTFRHASWSIVACAGALEADLVRRIGRARERGRAVTVGPHTPVYDANFQPLSSGVSADLGRSGQVPGLLPFDKKAIADAVAHARDTLELCTLPVEPEDLRVTLHRDVRGTPRVLFVINATERETTGRVSLAGAYEAEDLLDGSIFRASVGALTLELPPRTARMLFLRR
jgi:beta-galactosidase